MTFSNIELWVKSFSTQKDETRFFIFLRFRNDKDFLYDCELTIEFQKYFKKTDSNQIVSNTPNWPYNIMIVKISLSILLMRVENPFQICQNFKINFIKQTFSSLRRQGWRQSIPTITNCLKRLEISQHMVSCCRSQSVLIP